MKKLNWIIPVLLASVLLGCQSAPSRPLAADWTCSQKDTRISLTQSEGAVKSFHEQFLMGWDALQFDNTANAQEQRAQALALLDTMFGDVEGVEFSVDPRQEGVQVDLSIDFAQASLDQLEKAHLIEKGWIKKDHVDAEKMLKALESQGLACAPEVE